MFISSLTFLRLSFLPVRAAFMACPKAAKSYKGTGLFAIIIHPTTFYCSFLCLDMSTQFLSLAKIIHILHLLLFGYPYIIILIEFEERTGELWNICLAQKQQKNGAFQKDGYRNFVRTIEYRAFQKLAICG